MQKSNFQNSFGYGVEAEFREFMACKFLKNIKGGATDNQVY